VCRLSQHVCVLIVLPSMVVFCSAASGYTNTDVACDNGICQCERGLKRNNLRCQKRKCRLYVHSPLGVILKTLIHSLPDNAVRLCSVSDASFRHMSRHCRTEVRLWVKVTLSVFHRGGGVSVRYAVFVGYRILRVGQGQRMVDHHQTRASVWW